MKKFIRMTMLLALMLTCAFSQAEAKRKFNQLVGFGDSTLDTGYFRHASSGNVAVNAAIASAIASGAQGGFAGPGVMTTTFLAERFGLSAEPVSGGGSNYANGATYTAPLRASAGSAPASGSLPNNVSTTQQISNYLSVVGGRANPNALYIINTGNNDLIFMENQSAAWRDANPHFLNEVAAQFVSSMAALQAAGARTLIVPNTFYTSTLVGLDGVPPEKNADAYSRAVAYGAMKWSALAAAGVRFIPADLTSLFQFVTVNPTLFGFTPSSVLASNSPSPVAALVTSWADITPQQMQTHLFIDGKHLTTAGQRIEADYYSNLLTAPNQMSLLAEGPVQAGLTRAAAIQGQIDLSERNRGPNGFNVWASGGGGLLEIQNDSGFVDQQGVPFTGAAGADYRTPFGLILGAAFAAGTQTQNYADGAGHNVQNEKAASLYAGYKIGPVWGDATASYGLCQNTINRNVPLGRFMDHNSAEVAGHSLGFAVRLGGDLQLGPLTTGPTVGLLIQRVSVPSFSEFGTSGVTALSYGEQRRDSTISQLGWRILAELGSFQPFVEARWNHEFMDYTREVTAALTSIAAPAYSIEGPPVTSDWGALTLGSSFRVSERVMLRASFSTMFSNPNMVNYGGDLGLNLSF